MNPLRKKVLIAVAALVVVALFFPPWRCAHPMNKASMGYHLIFSPPKDPNLWAGSEIDATRLIMELAAIGLVGFVVLKVVE